MLSIRAAPSPPSAPRPATCACKGRRRRSRSQAARPATCAGGRHLYRSLLPEPAGLPAGLALRLDGRGLPLRSPGNVRWTLHLPVPENRGNGRRSSWPRLLAMPRRCSALRRWWRPELRRVCDGLVGHAAEDIPTVLGLSEDLRFQPGQPQPEGFLDFLFLGRLMLHRGSGRGRVRRQDRHAPPLVAGASKGGTRAGVTAVAPDFERAALIVRRSTSACCSCLDPVRPYREIPTRATRAAWRALRSR